eukprot:Clim_evm17s200 gene=Clim_evmTU17s200
MSLSLTSAIAVRRAAVADVLHPILLNVRPSTVVVSAVQERRYRRAPTNTFRRHIVTPFEEEKLAYKRAMKDLRKKFYLQSQTDADVDARILRMQEQERMAKRTARNLAWGQSPLARSMLEKAAQDARRAQQYTERQHAAASQLENWQNTRGTQIWDRLEQVNLHTQNVDQFLTEQNRKQHIHDVLTSDARVVYGPARPAVPDLTLRDLFVEKGFRSSRARVAARHLDRVNRLLRADRMVYVAETNSSATWRDPLVEEELRKSESKLKDAKAAVTKEAQQQRGQRWKLRTDHSQAMRALNASTRRKYRNLQREVSAVVDELEGKALEQPSAPPGVTARDWRRFLDGHSREPEPKPPGVSWREWKLYVAGKLSERPKSAPQGVLAREWSLFKQGRIPEPQAKPEGMDWDAWKAQRRAEVADLLKQQ